MEDSLEVISANSCKSAKMPSLLFTILVKTYLLGHMLWSIREKSSLTKICNYNRMSINNVFKKLLVFSLIQPQNTTNGWLQCRIWNYIVRYSYFVTLKCTDLYLTLWMTLLLRHDFIASYIDRLKNFDSLVIGNLSNVDTFHYIIKKSHWPRTNQTASLENSLKHLKKTWHQSFSSSSKKNPKGKNTS